MRTRILKLKLIPAWLEDERIQVGDECIYLEATIGEGVGYCTQHLATGACFSHRLADHCEFTTEIRNI